MPMAGNTGGRDGRAAFGAELPGTGDKKGQVEREGYVPAYGEPVSLLGEAGARQTPAPVSRAPEEGSRAVSVRSPSTRARILFFPDTCERLQGGTCERCGIVCPVGAISFDEATGVPRVDAGACTGCAVCVGICDAFSTREVTPYDFAKRVERRASQHGSVYLCCEEDVFEGLKLAANVYVVPCLAALPPELLAYLLARGVQLVLAHDSSYCDGCSRGGRFAGVLWKRSFELAQEWTNQAVRCADEIPEDEGFMEKMAAPDRRGLFTNALEAAADVTSGRYRASKNSTVEDFLARRERMRASARALPQEPLFLSEESRERSQESRRFRKRLLKEAIDADPAIAGRLTGVGEEDA